MLEGDGENQGIRIGQVGIPKLGQTLRVLADVPYCRSIGVSNFEVGDLEQLLEVAQYKPVVNQVLGFDLSQCQSTTR